MDELLYHYTSMDRFAQILKNRTIRLSPLDKMDDLQENITKDIKNIGRFFFASCWTAEEEESIPMWNMYTDIKAGVRIGLPKNPFVWHGTTVEDLTAAYGQPPSSPSQNANTFLNLASLIKMGVFSPQAWGGDILKQIIYTSDLGKLEPNLATIADSKLAINTAPIGVYKNTHWEFQKEWRYLMMFLPIDLKTPVPMMQAHFDIIINRLYRGELEPPFDHFDLDLSSEAMEKMTITPSPKMTAGNRIILDALVERYNPSCQIRESSLWGKL